jgi:hypothetical protein
MLKNIRIIRSNSKIENVSVKLVSHICPLDVRWSESDVFVCKRLSVDGDGCVSPENGLHYYNFGAAHCSLSFGIQDTGEFKFFWF